MLQRFFTFANLLPMPVWLAMMFAPGHPLTERASRSSAVFIVVGLNYAASLAMAILGGKGQPSVSPMEMASLDGVARGLGSRRGALAGWTHMLALDLFAGAWIYGQCRQLGAPGYVRVPALMATLMAGPLGLVGFLIWRALAGSR